MADSDDQGGGPCSIRRLYVKSLQPHCPHWGTLVHKYLIVITAIKDLSLNIRPRASHVPGGVFPQVLVSMYLGL